MKFIWILLLLARTSHAAVAPAPVAAYQLGPWAFNSSSGTLDTVAFDVSVAAGTGSSVFSTTATVRNCAVVPAVSTATYSLDVYTADGFPSFGTLRPITGLASLLVNKILVGAYEAVVTGATSDGTYRVRCYEIK